MQVRRGAGEEVQVQVQVQILRCEVLWCSAGTERCRVGEVQVQCRRGADVQRYKLQVQVQV